MAEIYRDSLPVLSLGLDTATAVTVDIKRDGTSVASPTVGSGNSFTVPFSVTGFDGPFTVEWTFTYDGVTTTRQEIHNVVTPYVTLQEIKDALTLPPGITDAKLIRTERLVRKIIDRCVGFSFGKYLATKRILGKGDEQLALPERLVSITSVSGPYLNPAVNNYEIRGNGLYLAASAVYPDGDWVFNNVIAAPDWSATHMWKDNLGYLITGIWGWEDVPEEVTEVALILIEQQLCPDSEYRDRYLEDVTYGDTSLSFNAAAYTGTGNVIADQLLRDFIRLPFTVI